MKKTIGVLLIVMVINFSQVLTNIKKDKSRSVIISYKNFNNKESSSGIL